MIDFNRKAKTTPKRYQKLEFQTLKDTTSTLTILPHKTSLPPPHPPLLGINIRNNFSKDLFHTARNTVANTRYVALHNRWTSLSDPGDHFCGRTRPGIWHTNISSTTVDTLGKRCKIKNIQPRSKLLSFALNPIWTGGGGGQNVPPEGFC